ncbi:DUF1178 family protein [Altererythrobacter luteolus]|uniref:DUF1178 family protein n=1 Tax=Pontixanthobacter luteolus TaxID=295089 RepID=A0A6I4UYK9_9SPHN|nr:DUF1178 family protein [Pontixanthobacter luteolus]MXP46575.1 DUF1178 family protein [Pontixanthobacter luteolus]
MIVFDLHCGEGHRFEGWFKSTGDFVEQGKNGYLMCPECGSTQIAKAPMAPAVPVKGNARAPDQPATSQSTGSDNVALSNNKLDRKVVKFFEKLATAQAQALKDSKWVGKDFADRSRAMHYGEQKQQLIHGEATAEQAQDLIDEGVAVAPLPFPVTPPEDLN